MIKAVIFDFDGVLVESVDIKTKAFTRLFEPEGSEACGRIVDYHVKNGGVSRFEKFRYIYSSILKRDLSDAVFNSLCERFASLVLEEVVRAPYVKGAMEFIGSYASKYSLFISSATPQTEIDEIVYRRGIGKYFRGVFGSPSNKKDIVGGIIGRSGFSADEAIYVGDAISDFEAASLHNVKFIARVTPDNRLFDSIECVKIKDLQGLRSLLEGSDNNKLSLSRDETAG